VGGAVEAAHHAVEWVEKQMAAAPVGATAKSAAAKPK